MLFMDGDDQFSFAVEAYRDLRAQDRVPPLLLVGVGYGASYSQPGNQRGRDYTHTPHEDEPLSGDADTFLEFLTTTLWKELARRFPLRDDARGIGGHSLGSLFALFALWQKPPFFTHYLLSSPSIWWDHRHILQWGRERHDWSARLPARVFLSVGSKDSKSMVGDVGLLEAQFAEKPFEEFSLTTRRFPTHDHFNVIYDAFHAGLEALWPAAQSSR